MYHLLLVAVPVAGSCETYEGEEADRQAEQEAQADAQAQGEPCIPPAWDRW